MARYTVTEHALAPCHLEIIPSASRSKPSTAGSEGSCGKVDDKSTEVKAAHVRHESSQQRHGCEQYMLERSRGEHKADPETDSVQGVHR